MKKVRVNAVNQGLHPFHGLGSDHDLKAETLVKAFNNPAMLALKLYRAKLTFAEAMVSKAGSLDDEALARSVRAFFVECAEPNSFDSSKSTRIHVQFPHNCLFAD